MIDSELNMELLRKLAKVSTGLVDLGTMAEVALYAPQPTSTPPVLGRLILGLLSQNSTIERRREGADYRWYYRMGIGELRKSIPEEFSSHMIGKTARAMGLTTHRMNDGYVVFWSGEQLALLSKYFEMG